MISELANGITDSLFLLSCYISVLFLVLRQYNLGEDFFIMLLKILITMNLS